MKKTNLLFTISFIFFFPLQLQFAAGLGSIDLEYDASVTASNPFRGFVPFIGEFMEPGDFPHSMEFFYVPLKDLINENDSYTFDTGLEPNLGEIDGRNHQSIFRVYLDYPGEPTGIPDFLLTNLSLNSYTDYGGGQCPDYTNEPLISTLEQFIAELGANYDGDKRIAFIEIGLLGFWGEWHTYPHESWFPNKTIQNRILYAFDNAFNTTHILVRYPTADSPSLNMGFHDDSFAYESIGSDEWVFYNLIIEAGAQNRWQEFPIGGEIYPDIQTTMWELIPPSDVQDYEQCVSSTHASWLIYDEIFYGRFTSGEKNRAKEGALLLGYKFTIDGISSNKNGTIVSINATIENIGNAPFYYSLDAVFGIREFSEDDFTDIGTISGISSLPGEKSNVYIQFDLNQFGFEDFEVNLKLTSEMTKIPIFFANENTLSDGSLIVCSTYPQKNIPWSTKWFIISLVSVLTALFIKIRRSNRKKSITA